MFTAGFIVAVFLVGALTLFALGGIRLAGRGGILLGICGTIYSVVVYPEYILLVVFPLSVLFVLGGCIAVVRRRARTTGSQEATHGRN